jgi:hypothetical protein
MKIGMIFECVPGGPDQQVCEYLAKTLVPDITLVKSVTLLNKEGVLKRCGEVAKIMLDTEKCDRVIIIWDYRPSDWGPEHKVGPDEVSPCLHRDRVRIFSALHKEEVELERIHLVCLDAMLETWLLAEPNALLDVLTPMTRHKNRKRVKMPSLSNFHLFPNPKDNLDRIFRDNARPYFPSTHALQIVRAMSGLTGLREVETFVRFAERISGLSRQVLFPKTRFPPRYLPSWDQDKSP